MWRAVRAAARGAGGEVSAAAGRYLAGETRSLVPGHG
jgi:hypothetical protein